MARFVLIMLTSCCEPDVRNPESRQKGSVHANPERHSIWNEKIDQLVRLNEMPFVVKFVNK